MPLLRLHRVVEVSLTVQRLAENRPGCKDSGHKGEAFHRCCRRHIVPESDPVPSVQAEFAVALFEFPVFREYPFQPHYAQILQGGGKGGGTGGHVERIARLH